MNRELPRGTVTLLFTDVEGSTKLLDAVGAQYGDLLADHHRLLRAVWDTHGGTEVDTEGDAFFVVFTDANAAVAAAGDAHRALGAHRWPGDHTVQIRIGVHTGTPAIRDGRYWGSDVHYAARLGAAAHGGQVLVSESTRTLARAHDLQDLGPVVLKDFPAPRTVFHLVLDGVSAAAFPPPRSVELPRSNLPAPVSALVGRDRELAQLIDRVGARDRLITIVGPGGTGKTRLAIELGHRIAGDFDSAWFVALEQVTDPNDVAGAVARTIGLPEMPGVTELDRVVAHLRDRRPLLVLDNAEHLLDAAPQLAQLAAAGEDARIIVTSQAPLSVAAEHVLRLDPLELPTGGEADLQTLAAVPAVSLLLQRAQTAGASFTLTGENAGDVARLCAQLEGMPLAIELAAARLDLMGPAALADRLERGIDALGKGRRDLPARQRGLRAVLDWTTGLLEPEVREQLSALAAFAAGFSYEIAEAAFGDLADELEVLLDLGLVRRNADGRLALRPPVRRYALELASPEQETAAHTAVARALAELGERFAPRSLLAEVDSRLALNPETSNILAAMDWAREHDAPLHARLCAAVGAWMNLSNLGRTGRVNLELALERTEDAYHRAACLQALGMLDFASADPTRSLAAAELWRDLGEPTRETLSLIFASIMQHHRGDFAEAGETVKRAARVASAVTGDVELEIWVACHAVGYEMREPQDFEEGHARLTELLLRARPGSMTQFQVAAILIGADEELGRLDEALAHVGVCMRVLGPIEVVMLQTLQVDAAAWILAACGRIDEAATALGLSDLLHEELSWPPTPVNQVGLEETRAAVGGHLGAGRRRAGALGISAGLVWLTNLVAENGSS